MTRARSRLRLVAIAVVWLLAVAACSEDTPDEPGALIVPVPRAIAPARTVGFDTTTFRVGVIADLSGPGAASNRSLLAGVEAYWSSVNALGGVDGRYPVELVVRDVGPSPSAAVTAYADLEPDVSLFALVAGTELVDAVRELAASDEVLIVPGSRHSTWGDEAALLPIGSSYAAESFNGVAWLSRDDAEPAAWCVVTDGSAVGADQLVGVLLAEQALAEVDSPSRIDVAGLASAPLVAAVTEAGCERIWMGTDAAEASRVLDAFAAADLDMQVGVGGEVLLPPSSRTLPWATEHLIVVTDAPSWGDEVTGAAQLRTAVDGYLPDARPDLWLRTGFASQYAVDVILRSGTLAGDVSRATLWATGGALEDVNAGGLVAAHDRTRGVDGVPTSVTVFAIDGLAGDPLGLRVVERYESVGVGELDLLIPPE